MAVAVSCFDLGYGIEGYHLSLDCLTGSVLMAAIKELVLTFKIDSAPEVGDSVSRVLQVL